jgi:hypothetical protein
MALHCGAAADIKYSRPIQQVKEKDGSLNIP